MENVQIIDEELRMFVLYCRELPDLYDRKEQAAFDYYNTVGSPRIKSTLEAKYQKSVSPPVDRSIELMQRKDDLIAEYEWKASFCRMIQHKLMRLSDDEIELLYWRYEQRFTLRQLGQLYCYGKDAMSDKLDFVLRKLQNHCMNDDNLNRKAFKSGFFSRRLPEATEEFYPDSPMELDQDVLDGKKKLILDVEPAENVKTD